MSRDNVFILKEDDPLGCLMLDKSYVCFDGVITFLLGLSSVSFCLSHVKEKQSSFKPNQYLHFEGRKSCTNKIYYIYPYEVLKHITSNQWPSFIHIYFKEKTIDDTDDDVNTFVTTKKFFVSLGQAVYIQFWETMKEYVFINFGKNPKSWQDVIKIGWIIRNALAHNFRIAINDKSISNVRWNNLCYGSLDNDVDISEQMMFFELIVLMKEIEDEIRKVNK